MPGGPKKGEVRPPVHQRITDADNLPVVPRNPGGRETTFRPEYPQMLVDHMRQGNSFESFGALANCPASTLYDWAREHPEFAKAKKTGRTYLSKFYEDMGKMIATGQLRRITKEEPALDASGKPIYDAKGNVVYKREYEATSGNSTAWIFLTKNLLGWRDKKEIEVSGEGGGPIPLAPMKLTDIIDRAQRLLNKAVQPPEIEEEGKVIEHGQ